MTWTIREMIDTTNLLSDEDLEDAEVITFFNDALAKINVFCKTIFPFIPVNVLLTTPYEGFDENWQRALLVPFAVGRSKQIDDMISPSYDEFTSMLQTFKSEYMVPDIYKNPNVQATRFEDTFENNPYRWGNGREYTGPLG